MKIIRHEAIIAFLVLIIELVSSNISSRDFGKHFHGCLHRIAKQQSIRGLVGKKVEFYCKSVEQFRTSNERDYPGKKLSSEEIAWCNGLYDKSEHNIVKRQAEGKGKGRTVRKEYRALSDKERHRYHKAIQALQSDMIGNYSQYAILARLHTGMTQVTAHGGCNFLGFHRAYLNMYETALKLKDPSVALPYWDSTLDYYMAAEDQEQSIIWSDDFLGNPQGIVTTGFAANWSAGHFGLLTRNVGNAAGAALMNDDEIRNVTSQRNMKDICGDFSLIENDLEFIHGPPHIFVDGQMGNIESASYEPAFWMHHAFIDLIWEIFRENSERAGVDIENDYPTEGFGDIFHHADRPMGLGNATVKSGLRKKLIKDKYRYAPRPTCTLSGPHSSRKRNCAGSPYLKCMSIDGRPKCVSKTIQEVEDDKNQPPTSPPVCPKPYPKPKPYPGHKPVQNTFCANGKSDAKEWVYLPIRIMTSRPPDYHGYNSYRVENGHANRNTDQYNPSDYSEFRQYIRPGRPKTFSQCKTENATAGQIFIQSDGLNYDGTYKDYAIVDNRMAITLSITYVAVKDPEKTMLDVADKRYRYSDVLLSAFDSCGRICRANCLIPGSSPPTYRPCSGAIRVTPNTFNQNFYGRDYGGASMNIWDFRREKRCPQFMTDQIFVSFYCDYSDRWPWPSSLSTPPSAEGPEPFIQPPEPTKPALKECAVPLPWDRNSGSCIIEREDCGAQCTATAQIFKCKGTCDEYSWCSRGTFGVTMCRYGQEFDYNNGKPRCLATTREKCPAAYNYRKRQLARLALTRGRGAGGRGRRQRRGLN